MSPEVITLLSNFWLKLTRPHPSLTDPEERRRARLLATVVLFFVPLLALAYISSWLFVEGYDPLREPVFWMGVGMEVANGLIYALSRTTQHRIGSITLTTILAIGPALVPIFLPENEDLVIWVMFGLLLANLLLPLRFAVALTATGLAFATLAPAVFNSQHSPLYTFILIFVAVSSVFLLLYSFYRQRDLENMRRERASAEAANEASRLKSQFLATMSHELRTPLNSVIGFADINQQGIAGEMSEQVASNNTRILESSRILLRLIDDLLDISRIEEGRMELISQPVNVTRLEGHLKTMFERTAQAKGITFSVTTDKNLPAYLLGDDMRLKQIVTNLVSNALKFTQEGEVRVQMERTAPDEWQIEVRDTGIGIPPHATDMIFDKFSQVDGKISRAYGGAGLGLAIVRDLVVLMGGQVTVQSKYGEWSIFRVRLPLAPTTRPNSSRKIQPHDKRPR